MQDNIIKVRSLCGVEFHTKIEFPLTGELLNESHERTHSGVLVRPVLQWAWAEGAQESDGLALTAHCVGRHGGGHGLEFHPAQGRTDELLWCWWW